MKSLRLKSDGQKKRVCARVALPLIFIFSSSQIFADLLLCQRAFAPKPAGRDSKNFIEYRLGGKKLNSEQISAVRRFDRGQRKGQWPEWERFFRRSGFSSQQLKQLRKDGAFRLNDDPWSNRKDPVALSFLTPKDIAAADPRAALGWTFKQITALTTAQIQAIRLKDLSHSALTALLQSDLRNRLSEKQIKYLSSTPLQIKRIADIQTDKPSAPRLIDKNSAVYLEWLPPIVLSKLLRTDKLAENLSRDQKQYLLTAPSLIRRKIGPNLIASMSREGLLNDIGYINSLTDSQKKAIDFFALDREILQAIIFDSRREGDSRFSSLLSELDSYQINSIVRKLKKEHKLNKENSLLSSLYNKKDRNSKQELLLKLGMSEKERQKRDRKAIKNQWRMADKKLPAI